jgi:hypothetical protein
VGSVTPTTRQKAGVSSKLLLFAGEKLFASTTSEMLMTVSASIILLSDAQDSRRLVDSCAVSEIDKKNQEPRTNLNETNSFPICMGFLSYSC